MVPRYAYADLIRLRVMLRDPDLNLRPHESWTMVKNLIEEILELRRVDQQHQKYRSSACVHFHHGDCASSCKYCGRPCDCECHSWSEVDRSVSDAKR